MDRVREEPATDAIRIPIFLMTNSLETGGSERQFSALARALDPKCFDVHLGCIMQEGPFVSALGGMPEFPLGGSLYGFQSIRTRLRLARHLKSSGIAIAHAFDFYTNLTLIPAARWAGVPVVIGSQRQLGDLLTWKQERALAAVLRLCDAVVCNSQAAASRLKERGLRPSRLRVIGNGLPPECFAEATPLLPASTGKLRVGMIARMNTRAKNHQLFLLAARKLADRFPALEFVLGGDGPLRAELERDAAQLGLGEQVIFLGDRRDIPAVLASIDVSVLPSSSESLSNVILESMAAGVPVVATRVGGNIELLAGDRGVLVAPNDADALGEGIARLLANEGLRARLGKDARRFAQANFTLEQMQKRHEELYAELLERKQPSQGRNLGVRRMRVAPRTRVSVVAASLRYVGGQSTQAELLMRGWRDDKEIEAQFIPIDPAFPAGLRWAERIPLLRTLIRQPLYLYELWGGLRDSDIAHIFSASYSAFVLATASAWMVARWRGKKTLIHYHSGEARDHLQRSSFAQEVLKKTDALVVPSGFLIEVFRDFGLNAQSIPNIVDISQFSFRDRRTFRPHLICTRGFHRYYSVDVVVRAFAEVKETYPEAQLDLLGGGPEEEKIRALVRELGLAGVNFKGVAAWDQIARFYDEADIFVNASNLDNMPVSILEAFAAGLPVVTTEPDGIRFVVEDGRTGLLSPVGDAKALAGNVIRLLRDASLAQHLVWNAQREMERYSWPVVRKQWLEAYREIARVNSPKSLE